MKTKFDSQDYEPEFNRSEIEERNEAKEQADIEKGEAERVERALESRKEAEEYLDRLIRSDFDRQGLTIGYKGYIIKCAIHLDRYKLAREMQNDL